MKRWLSSNTEMSEGDRGQRQQCKYKAEVEEEEEAEEEERGYMNMNMPAGFRAARRTSAPGLSE
jgi:hypothetical protein